MVRFERILVSLETRLRFSVGRRSPHEPNAASLMFLDEMCHGLGDTACVVDNDRGRTGERDRDTADFLWRKSRTDRVSHVPDLSVPERP